MPSYHKPTHSKYFHGPRYQQMHDDLQLIGTAPQDSRFDNFRLLTRLPNSPSRKSKTHIRHPGLLNKTLEHRLNLSAIHPPSLRPHLPTPHTLHPLAAMSKAYWFANCSDNSARSKLPVGIPFGFVDGHTLDFVRGD